MGGFWKAALVGALVAVLLAAGVGVAAYLGLLEGILPQQDIDRLLVIATAPDKDGTEVATIAFVLEADGSRSTILDTLEPVTVAGTSAQNAREALPFGGGAAVAEALSGQTGGKALPWVVLPTRVWERLVDATGGVTATVPAGVNAYSTGRLTIVSPGTRTLTGAEAVALASAVDYAQGGSAQAKSALGQLSGALADVAAGSLPAIKTAIADGDGSSSLSADQFATFATTP